MTNSKSKTKEMTEQEVRRIAREESQEVFEKSVKDIKAEIAQVKLLSVENKEVLARLERLLLGEMGVDKDDTLKAKATYAYSYAKRNTDLNIVGRAIPALEWFEDWNKPEPGYEDSKMDVLGKMIVAYNRIKWLLALFGITTLVNAIPALKIIAEFISHFTQ
jgi:hypothetical protein